MRFNAGKEEQFWYYGALVRAFTQRCPEDPLVKEFARVVKELKEFTREDTHQEDKAVRYEGHLVPTGVL